MKVSLNDWHEQLADTNKDTLLKLVENTFADLTIPSCDGEHESDTQHCEASKHHRLPFNSVPKRKRPDNPLELIHSGLCECHIISMGGGRYLLTFIDDYFRHCCRYILSNKNSFTLLAASKNYQTWLSDKAGTRSRNCERIVVESTWTNDGICKSNLMGSRTSWHWQDTPLNQTSS